MKRTPLKIPSHQQIMGGAHGNLSAKWQRMAPNIWCLVPDPGLKLAVRKDYGPYLGEVAYDAARGICTLEVRSRHGRRWSFTGPARTAADARQALCDKIAAATANPAWVSGFDDWSAAVKHADDMKPWWGAPREPYPFELGDRLAAAINSFWAVDASVARTVRGRPHVSWWRAHGQLTRRSNEVYDVVRRSPCFLGTREGARVLELVLWGSALLALSHRGARTVVGLSAKTPLAVIAGVAGIVP